MKHVLILTLNNSSPKGGSEKLWRRLADELVTSGYRVTASVYKHQRGHNEKSLDQSVTIRTRFPRRHGRSSISRLSNYLFGSLLEHKQISRDLKVCQPDFVFFSFGGFAELDNPKILTALAEHNVPYATVFHSNTENYVFQRSSIQMARQFWLNSSNNFVVSHRIAEIFERQIGMRHLNAKLVVNPMDKFSETSTDLYDNLDEIVRMAFIGTLDVGVKGIALLIQVLSAANFGNSIWELSLFGEGPDRDIIEELISQFGLESQVTLKGWTDNIDQIWNDHHLLVLPSFNEGMPMVIHEAMLRQRVVIATDVGGNAEIITNKVNGFLAPSASFTSLKQTMELAFDFRNDWANIASKARPSIIEAREAGHTIQDIMHAIDHELN